jgi:hypothetical protein
MRLGYMSLASLWQPRPNPSVALLCSLKSPREILHNHRTEIDGVRVNNSPQILMPVILRAAASCHINLKKHHGHC